MSVIFFSICISDITIFHICLNIKLWQCDRKRKFYFSLSFFSSSFFFSLSFFFNFLLPLSGILHFINIEWEITFCDACAFANDIYCTIINSPFLLTFLLRKNKREEGRRKEERKKHHQQNNNPTYWISKVQSGGTVTMERK